MSTDVELVFNMSTIHPYAACKRRLHWLILPLVNLCDSARHSSTIAYYYYSTVFFYKKQLVIHKYIIKYQQNHNQTILAYNFMNFLRT